MQNVACNARKPHLHNKNNMTFKEFYNQFGLTEYPFSIFTTENEKEKFSKTFIKPNDYETISENFSQKNSILLTGDRGTGKTAIIKDFISKLNSDTSIISHIIDFSQLKINYELQDFYKFLINNITYDLFSTLTDKTSRIKNLDKEDKILLCYLLKNFIPQLSKSLLSEKIKKIQVSWLSRNFKKIENIVRGLFNYGATTGGVFIDEYIAKHFTGLPPLSESLKIKDFFPELPLNVENEFIDQETTYHLLLRILKLIKKLGFDRMLVVFDRVDEDSRFSNDAENISDFIVKILTDNKLLLEEDIQIVFSTWVTPFNFIKDQIRTQKHYCPTLNWTKDDLSNALNRRLSVYSNETINEFKDIFESSVSEEEINELFEIANNNPRDLWHIFNCLFNAQFEQNSNSNKIEKEAISKALYEFVTKFNYYEYYPRKSNARANSMDIYSYAKYLLKLDSEIFTKNQLNEKANIGSSISNYVIGMERIGLIRLENQQGGVTYFKIKDPKIIYALKNEFELRRD
jgi:hypothetical protein